MSSSESGRQFINQPRQVVGEALEGCARLRHPDGSGVRLSDPASGMRLVVRDDWARDQVALISGGGSGHEPAHAGFVGAGMLTAAVCGELFASPTVDAVLAAIREVTGEAGALLIVKNYTGDRLNFGLAAERARQEGFKVEMVIVADDVALPDNPQPRGLAGTLLVHKVTGALAARGAGLKEITAVARRVADSCSTLGVAFNVGRHPGKPREQRAPELGLGIHGEPGAMALELGSDSDTHGVHAVMDTVVTALVQGHSRKDVGGDLPASGHLLLINDLGGCSALERSLLLEEALTHPSLQALGIHAVVGPQPLMTSLDMHGFSLTLLPLDSLLEEALSASCAPVAWPGVQPVTPLAHFTPSQDAARTAGDEASDARRAQAKADCQERAARGVKSRAGLPGDPQVEQRLRAALEILLASEADLDRLDAISGDGDTGSTFASGARAVIEALEDCELACGDSGELMTTIGKQLAHGMGGSSGVLLSTLFTAAATRWKEQSDAHGQAPLGHRWHDALSHGVARMQHYGGASRGDRSLLDALLPALEALQASVQSEKQASVQPDQQGDQSASPAESQQKIRAGRVDWAAMARAARQGADATAEMAKARAGRSAYVPSAHLVGNSDPGAEAVARVFEALADAAEEAAG
ncbi:dihydroxyacetone kinase subunit DhaK [Cobetia sp. D5]|uniref:dihydroxyacetone kinase subunit DhaK n=1 Tax=Cobetia sp. D5 TaxID=3105867 RepID=UPI002D77061A|nr:dihydroxyacetone kinase subunit DhaK [Cobetia sp. D5]